MQHNKVGMRQQSSDMVEKAVPLQTTGRGFMLELCSYKIHKKQNFTERGKDCVNVLPTFYFLNENMYIFHISSPDNSHQKAVYIA